MSKQKNKTKNRKYGGEQTPTPRSRSRTRSRTRTRTWSRSKSSSAKSLKKSVITNPIEYMLSEPKAYVDEYGGLSPPESVSPLSPFNDEEDKSKYEKYLSFEIIFHLQKELDENTKELPKPDQSLFLGLVTAQNLHKVAWLTNVPFLNKLDLAGFTDRKQPVGKRINLFDANNALAIACEHVKKIRDTDLLKVIDEIFEIFEELLMDLFQKQYAEEKPTWFFGGDMENYLAFQLECETYLNTCIYNYKKDINEKFLSFITDTCK